MRYEDLTASPPDDMRSSADIAAFGERTRERFQGWWDEVGDQDFDRDMEVYFGTTSRHEMLERTVWHTTQHVRQLASLLEQAGDQTGRAAHFRRHQRASPDGQGVGRDVRAASGKRGSAPCAGGPERSGPAARSVPADAPLAPEDIRGPPPTVQGAG